MNTKTDLIGARLLGYPLIEEWFVENGSTKPIKFCMEGTNLRTRGTIFLMLQYPMASKMGVTSYWYKLGDTEYQGIPFSLSNKADRMDVVEALGEKHGVYITRSDPNNYWATSNATGLHDTYEEATRAALESLADVYLKGGE